MRGHRKLKGVLLSSELLSFWRSEQTAAPTERGRYRHQWRGDCFDGSPLEEGLQLNALGAERAVMIADSDSSS